MAPRRARGNGSIRKRGRALYLRYRPPGQARQVEESFPRHDSESMPAYRQRAEAALAKITLSVAAGTRNAPTPRTLEELAEAYLAWVRSTVKASTYDAYESQIRLYILPFFRSKKVSQLATEDVHRFHAYLLQRPVAGGTLATTKARVIMGRLRDLIKHALDGANAREYWGISFDPWPQRRFRWPDERERPAPRTHAPYSLDEAQRYVAVAPECLRPHVLAILLLMLRDGEFRAMRWVHLDWEERVYTVRETYSREHGFTTTKTASSEASVPMPEVLIDALKHHKARQADLRLRSGTVWQDLDLIFSTETGAPLPHGRMSQGWHPDIVERAQLRYVTLHTLRKTGASLLESIPGVAREETQAALRHKRLSVTDRYVAVYMEQRRKHIEQLADLLTSPPPFPQSSLKLG